MLQNSSSFVKFNEHLKQPLGQRVSVGHWQISLHPALAHFFFLWFKIQPRKLEAIAFFPTSTVQTQIYFLPTRKKGNFGVRTAISWLLCQAIWILLIRSSRKPGPQQKCWPYLLSMLQSWSYGGNLGNTQCLQKEEKRTIGFRVRV